MSTNKRDKKRLSNRYKRIRAVLFLLLFAVIVITLFSERELSGFDRSSMKEIGDPNAKVPELKAEGAELYCVNMEEAIYQKNADEKIDPYSITKILTCYIALENLEPDEMVTVSEHAATPLEDGTTIWLKEGEKISVKDLLYGAMLESGNDAATALAEAVSGSEEKFADVMNEQAKEWGCENTHFVNANGWKNKNHYTTAHDFAIITARCFESEELCEIAMTEEYTSDATNMSEARTFESHTLSGKKIENLVGGKTGGWTSKDMSLAVKFKKGNLEGVVVVLRTPKRKNDVNKLIAVSQDLTPGYTVTEEGSEVCEARVKGGKTTKTKLCASETINAYPKDHKRKGIKVKFDRDKIEAPVKAGTVVGTYTVYENEDKLQTGKLMAMEDIEKGWFPSAFYISNRTTALLGAVIILWMLLLAVLKRTNI